MDAAAGFCISQPHKVRRCDYGRTKPIRSSRTWDMTSELTGRRRRPWLMSHRSATSTASTTDYRSLLLVLLISFVDAISCRIIISPSQTRVQDIVREELLHHRTHHSKSLSSQLPVESHIFSDDRTFFTNVSHTPTTTIEHRIPPNPRLRMLRLLNKRSDVAPLLGVSENTQDELLVASAAATYWDLITRIENPQEHVRSRVRRWTCPTVYIQSDTGFRLAVTEAGQVYGASHPRDNNARLCLLTIDRGLIVIRTARRRNSYFIGVTQQGQLITTTEARQHNYFLERTLPNHRHVFTRYLHRRGGGVNLSISSDGDVTTTSIREVATDSGSWFHKIPT